MVEQPCVGFRSPPNLRRRSVSPKEQKSCVTVVLEGWPFVSALLHFSHLAVLSPVARGNNVIKLDVHIDPGVLFASLNDMLKPSKGYHERGHFHACKYAAL